MSVSSVRGASKRVVGRVVDASGRHPVVVLLAAVAVVVASWWYAYAHFALNSDMLELLPQDSAEYQAFEHQNGRVGGAATLVVVVESPDRKANEAFVDKLADAIDADMKSRAACAERCGADAACAAGCGAESIGYVETGTKEVRKFFRDNKWLYADKADLKKADDTVDHEIAKQEGFGFDDDDAPATVDAGATPGGAATAGAPEPKKPALGTDEFRDRWEQKAKEHDEFPTGYFANEDGTRMVVRIVSKLGTFGFSGGESLLDRVRGIVDKIGPASIHPSMQVGYAGDIPNAIEEKASLVSDAVYATGFAFALIFFGIVVFFRSPWAPLIIVIPALIGVGVAYSFAMAYYGYVNTTGLFLGAIIVGNGINYPIVLLNRYREFRARGMTPEDARREAVLNAFRAELVGALVAAIAYGSLVVTQFRGFRQFGAIGFLGMLLVWLSMIPVVPAMLVVDDKIQAVLPSFLRDRPIADVHGGARGPVMRLIAKATDRAPWLFLAATALLVVYACVKLPRYVKDPWEYSLSNLGSKDTAQTGAGAWSTKSDEITWRMNVAGVRILADSAEQVPLVKQAILERDAKDPEGKIIADIATIDDLLPGTLAEQREKLAILDDIRARLNDRVVSRLDPAEQKRVLDLKPPDGLVPIEGKDLPPLLRRRFEENDGRIGTVMYINYQNVSFSDGKALIRMAKTTNNVALADGTVVQTASQPTVFAEVIRALERDGPLATLVSFGAVLLVVVFATSSARGAVSVIAALLVGVVVTLGGAAIFDMKLNFFNFIALPITFGIGCEYPFNIFDRSRLLDHDVASAVRLSGGAVALCSYTTTIGYGSMIFGDSRALESFGKLAMSGEIACLTGALLFLPALLRVWKVKPRKAPAPS